MKFIRVTDCYNHSRRRALVAGRIYRAVEREGEGPVLFGTGNEFLFGGFRLDHEKWYAEHLMPYVDPRLIRSYGTDGEGLADVTEDEYLAQLHLRDADLALTGLTRGPRGLIA